MFASMPKSWKQKTFQASGPFVLLHVHEFVLKKLLNKVLIKDQTSSLTCRKVPLKDLSCKHAEHAFTRGHIGAQEVAQQSGN